MGHWNYQGKISKPLESNHTGNTTYQNLGHNESSSKKEVYNCECSHQKNTVIPNKWPNDTFQGFGKVRINA